MAEFVDFVLSLYVSVCVEELDQDKLTPLLKLRYHNSITDTVADLGTEVGTAFAGFQKYLSGRGVIIFDGRRTVSEINDFL